MANVPQRAELKPTVQALLTQQLPARPTDQPVLALARALRMQQNITFTSELARDSVALDFYLLDSQYTAHFAFTISYTDHIGEVRLRLGARTGCELVLQPDFLAPVYVQVGRYPDDDTLPPQEVVPAKVGLFDERFVKPNKPGE